jgi:hypothetical protein
MMTGRYKCYSFVYESGFDPATGASVAFEVWWEIFEIHAEIDRLNRHKTDTLASIQAPAI